jgi:purine-cytosine permease-like protein
LAALQEYPALGRWADRWARLIAAAWVATLVAAMFLNFGPLMGFVMGSLETACSDLGDAIADQYAASLSAEDPSALPMLDTDRRMKIEASWWHANRDSILAARPSLRAWINWSVAWMWIPLSFIGFAGGACWSTCLLGTRRRFAIVPAMLPLLAAGVIGWTVHRQEASGTALVQASTLGIGALQNIVLGVMLSVVAFWVFMGVWLGRRVVRLVVRWSLPPRMRSSLAILWTRDGLPPPSGSCRIDG